MTLQCTQIGSSYNGMYWFRQRPSESLEPIVFYYVNLGTLEDRFQQKVSAIRKDNSLDLTVKELQSTDSGIYFCAKQDAQHDNLIFNLNKNYTTPTTNTYSAPVNCSAQIKYSWPKYTRDRYIKWLWSHFLSSGIYIIKCWFAFYQWQETNKHDDSALFISNHAGW